MPPLTLSNFHVMSISLVMVCSFNLDHLVLCPLFVAFCSLPCCILCIFVPYVSWLLFPVYPRGFSHVRFSRVLCIFVPIWLLAFGPVSITLSFIHRQSCFVHFRSHMVRGPG